MDITPRFTDGQIMTTLREVVAERPDYVYEPPEHMQTVVGLCFYVHTDACGNRPGCLVAQVMSRLGVPLTEMAEKEKQGAETAFRGYTSQRALMALAAAQSAQDNGRPWSAALSDAEQEYERR